MIMYSSLFLIAAISGSVYVDAVELKKADQPIDDRMLDVGGSGKKQFTSSSEVQKQVRMYCEDPSNYDTAEYGNMQNWDVSQVTSMYKVFDAYYNDKDNECDIPDISGWDVSQVTDFSYMFYRAAYFNQNIGNWDVSKSTSFYAMFLDATSFNQNIGNWDVSKSTSFRWMFSSATSFNQNIGKWDVSKSTNFGNTFHGATSFSQNIGNWDVSKSTNFSRMFYGASNFKQNLNSWLELVNIADYSTDWCAGGAFCDQGLTFAPTSSPSTAPSQETTFTSRDKLIAQVEKYCRDPRNYDTNYGRIEEWDVSQITDMESVFDATEYKCDIPDISKWDVSRVTNFKNMFYEAASFNVDIGNWDVSRVTSFYAMFRGATDFNQDISKWKVSKATNFGQMFHTAASFNQNIDNWHVSEAILFNSMFYRASSFNQNIGKWDVSKVTDFYMMLYSASSFRQNLHAWLEWVNKAPRFKFWCDGGAVCDAKDSCDGKTKDVCETLKDSCVFGKAKIFEACKPKNLNYAHNCADYDDEESCTDDENHGGLCKFNNDGCSHVCDDLNEKYCKKLKDKKDNKNICKPTKVNNPCNGCQLKTTCG